MTRALGPHLFGQLAARLAVAILVAGAVSLPGLSAPPAVHAAGCTAWSSTTAPPPTIRVLRSSGVVETVDFKTYVEVVMAAEWTPSWPIESLRAGAVAIKQYAWYYAMSYRGITGTGGCADIRDNNNDQVYSPETRTPSPIHVLAVESTWSESVTKNGTFLLTGYRPGASVACGADADGYHLYQHSAHVCAGSGQTGEQILHVYYDPGLVINGLPTPPGPPTAVSGLAYDSSVLVSWSPPASNGNALVASYTATSSPGGKTCTTTGSTMCAVSGLTNGTPYTFTVVAANSAGPGPASAPSAGVTPKAPPAATYTPLNPTRILDTRDGTGGSSVPLSSHLARTFQVTGGTSGVPSDATAVTGNLTVTQQGRGGYLYIGPVPMNDPSSSTLNFPVGDDRANAVTVTLGNGTSATAGSLSVTYVGSAPSTAHVVFDVTGYFSPDLKGATYHSLNPDRILDTRDGTGGSLVPLSSHVARTFQVTGAATGIPQGATAVTGNLTVTQQGRGGYLYLGPVPTNDPTNSTLNFPMSDDRANAVTVALGNGVTATAGTLSVTYVGSSPGFAHVIFDVTGYFTPDASGAGYVALTPLRILDTRDGTGLAGALNSHVARSFAVTGLACVPPTATAVTGNMTVTEQGRGGYLYVGPVGMNNPTSSTLNFPMNDDRANAVAVALGDGTAAPLGSLGVTYVGSSPTTAQVIFDVTGYFTR